MVSRRLAVFLPVAPNRPSPPDAAATDSTTWRATPLTSAPDRVRSRAAIRPRRRLAWILIAVLLLVAAFTATAQAQAPVGSVRVDAGPGLGGSAAAIRLESLDGPAWATEASLRTGAAPVVFTGLPPGRYEVIAKVAGARTVWSAVDVSPGRDWDLVVSIDRSGGTGPPVVSVRRWDRTSGTEAAVLGPQALTDLPSGRTFWSLIDSVVTGVVGDRIDNGGLWPADPPLLGIAGQSWTQTTFRLDAVDITAPRLTGRPMLLPSVGALQAVVVSQAQRGVEWGGAAPAIALVTRSPGRTWRREGLAFFTPDAWQSGVRTGVPPAARFVGGFDSDLSAGGPVGGERAGIFGTARFARTGRTEGGDPRRLTSEIESALAHLVAVPRGRGRLSLVYSADAITRPYAGRARLRDRGVTQDDTNWHTQAEWSGWTASGTSWSASGGYQRSVSVPETGLRPGANGLDDAGIVERLLDGPVQELFEELPGVQQRLEFAAVVRPRLEKLTRRHELRAGFELARSVATVVNVPTPMVAETVNGIPARLWDYHWSGPESRWTELEGSGHVADRVSLGSRAMLDAGLRVEAGYGQARGATNRVAWTTLLPRVGVRWSPRLDGGPTITGGYARYRHRLPLSVFAWGDRTAPADYVYRWVDANGDGVPEPREIGSGPIAAVGPCCNGALLNTIDPALKAPHADEWTVAVERPFRRVVVRLAGTDRRDRDLIESVNVGLDASDYAVRLIPDAGADYFGAADDTVLPVYDRLATRGTRDRYLLTNPPGHETRYQALEFTIHGSFGGHWYSSFSALAHRAEGNGASRGFRAAENDPGVVGELFDTPNADTNARGRLFVDRAYLINWSGGFRAAHDWDVAVAARYRDGQPFARVVVVPDLNQGAEAVLAYPRGRTRFMYTLTVDARVRKRVRLRRIRAAGVLDVFNLLNAANEVEEDPVSGPSFRTSTLVQPPRAMRLGLEVQF